MHLTKSLIIVGICMLLPTPAWAWGPAAHLDLGLNVLSDLSLVAPAIAVLLKKFPDDFLYGSIAADITIGKNLSPYYLHCHNWQVGFSILDLADKETTRAFAWGYLSHLAADVVAHNYFIPYKLVQYFQRRRAPHAYWEIRFDTRMRAEAWQLSRKLAAKSYNDHDRHLRKILTGPLFSFRVNKQLFNSMVLFNQLLRWKRMVDAHARRSTMVLDDQEVDESYRLSLKRILNLLMDKESSAALEADPTGHRNILVARDIRKRFRALHQEKRLLDPENIGQRLRPLFLHAMDHSKLKLPSMEEFIDPNTTDTPKKKTHRYRKTKHTKK